MSFTETAAVARAFAKSGEPALCPNQELLATGLATAGGALVGGISAGGGASQTAVNRLAGAHSQLAGLVTGGVTLLTLLFLAPLISLMPQATLAAVVIVYSVGLIQLPEFRAILAVRRTEFIWAVAAFAGRHAARYSQGHPRRHHRFPGVPRATGGRPARGTGSAASAGTNVFRPLSAEHPDDEASFWPPTPRPGRPAVLCEWKSSRGRVAAAD